MERKIAKSFDQTYVIEGDEVELLDRQSVTAVLGELASALKPESNPGNAPDSGDTVTMNVLVATSVDQILLSPEDDDTSAD